MNGPLVSVIIPVYNAAKYLKNAVNSVRCQTYTNLEIILINDRSQDDSLEICNKLAQNDSRVMVINSDVTLGAAGARNLGIDIARGECITFVDSDDYVHPRFVELLYQAMVDNDADISCCEFTRTFVNRKTVRDSGARVTMTRVASGCDMALNIVDYNSMFYVVLWNKLFKKSIWDGLRLPTGKRAEDFCISYEFLSKANKVVIIDANLYFYYQQKKSVMHIFDDFSIYMGEALDGFEVFLQEKITDEEKRKKYSELALIFRCDTVVEDYWKAYKKKDLERMEVTSRQALLLRRDMVMRHIPIRLKFNLFFGSKKLYKLGRGLIDVKEAVCIFFGCDHAGEVL